MENQNFTSANTSINGSKLPALYKKVDFDALASCGGLTILDYGCGKFDNARDYIEKEYHGGGCGFWYGYDPYNRTAEHNTAVMSEVNTYGVDAVLCANVLNVIDSDMAVYNAVLAVKAIPYAFRPCREVPFFFSVYEGDGEGVGRQTGKDQWQRNEKIEMYLRYFGYDTFTRKTVIKHGVITNYPEFVK